MYYPLLFDVFFSEPERRSQRATTSTRTADYREVDDDGDMDDDNENDDGVSRLMGEL